MNDIKNLEEILEILKVQEKMQIILEQQQAEIDSLKEQLEESLQLNDQLTRQNRKLQEQINVLSI